MSKTLWLTSLGPATSFLPTYLDRAYGARGLDGHFLWGGQCWGRREESHSYSSQACLVRTTFNQFLAVSDAQVQLKKKKSETAIDP